jgi:hypothetical protein
VQMLVEPSAEGASGGGGWRSRGCRYSKGSGDRMMFSSLAEMFSSLRVLDAKGEDLALA